MCSRGTNGGVSRRPCLAAGRDYGPHLLARRGRKGFALVARLDQHPVSPTALSCRLSQSPQRTPRQPGRAFASAPDSDGIRSFWFPFRAHFGNPVLYLNGFCPKFKGLRTAGMRVTVVASRG